MYIARVLAGYVITRSFIKVNKILDYTMDVDEILQLAECYIHQPSQHEQLSNEIKTIINDPLPCRKTGNIMTAQSCMLKGVCSSEVNED